MYSKFKTNYQKLRQIKFVKIYFEIRMLKYFVKLIRDKINPEAVCFRPDFVYSIPI